MSHVSVIAKKSGFMQSSNDSTASDLFRMLRAFTLAKTMVWQVDLGAEDVVPVLCLAAFFQLKKHSSRYVQQLCLFFSSSH